MKTIHMTLILFFVRRGLSITQACQRMNKSRNLFFESENTKLKLLILQENEYNKALKHSTIDKQGRYEDLSYLIDESLQYFSGVFIPNISTGIERYVGRAEGYSLEYKEQKYIVQSFC